MTPALSEVELRTYVPTPGITHTRCRSALAHSHRWVSALWRDLPDPCRTCSAGRGSSIAAVNGDLTEGPERDLGDEVGWEADREAGDVLESGDRLG